MKPFALFVAALALSCNAPPAATRGATDWRPAQRQAWAMVPADATVGVTVARLDHLLSKVRALRTLASAGPIGKKWIGQWLEQARAQLGFDPLDSAAWKAAGFDVDGPLGLFTDAHDGAEVFARVHDAAAAQAFVHKQTPAAVCAAHDGWLVCGSGPLPAAGTSLLPRVEKEAAAELGAEVMVFAPLERLAKDAPNGFLAGSRAAIAGLTLGDEVIDLVVRYTNPQLRTVVPYTRLDGKTASILGAAAGAAGISRLTFSPSALWKLAQDSIGQQTFNQGVGAAQMATGIDLDQDLIQNLTGEVVGAFYEDGLWSGAELFATRDDERTRKLVERLGNLLSGGIDTLKQMGGPDGLKAEHRVEQTHGRPAYVFSVDLTGIKDPTLQQLGGLTKMELSLTTGPGAIMLAFNTPSRERVLGQLGNRPEKVLDQLEPDARALFTSNAPVVGWAKYSDLGRLTKNAPWLGAYGLVHPDLPGAFTEMMALMELVWDATFAMRVDDNEAALAYRIKLL